MKNSTFSAQVANNLLTLLQGYSKTIRLLLVMFLTLTVTTNAWAEEETLACPAGTISNNKMTWNLSSCTIVHAKGSNNSYASYSPWRVYQGAIVTFTPKSNTSISKIVITAGSAAYASAGAKTWTNATASASGSTITVTPTDGTKEISVTASAQTRWSKIVITYTTSGGGGSTPTQLATPTGLTVDAITSSGATLSWNAVANASSYVVTIVDGGSYSQSYTVTETTKTVSGLTPSTDYLWTVTAVGDGTNYTNSEESETGEFTTSAPAGGGGGEALSYTWNLSTNSYSAASTNQVTWSAADVNMVIDKANAQTNANNYLPTSKTSTRFYTNSKLTITPAANVTITSVVFTATSTGYASALQGSTWTNASASVSGTTVTVTPTNGASAISATIGGTCGFTGVTVHYTKATSGEPEPVIVKTLKSIAVTGMKTTYEQGDIFKFNGTCTATYSVTKDGVAQPDETAEVTPTSVSTPNMNTIGTQTVTVTYSEGGVEKTAEYQITITENTVTAGTYCTGTLGYEFWGLNAEKTTATANEVDYTGMFDDITVNIKNGEKANAYFKADHTRVYSGGYTMTFTAPTNYVITAIAFTADGNNWEGTHTANVGTMTDSKNWAGSANEVTITFGGTCRIKEICVTYEELDETLPTVPTFNPVAGTYNAVQNVTISAEAGTTIYYTLDGTDPTTASDVYASAIEISETTTVKAIAVKDEKVSPVATATYTINLPLTTMDQIFAKATAVGSTATSVEITFGNWVVTGVKNSNAYVTDGTKGFIIYTASHGFLAGDILSGTVSCKVQLYKGSAELTELTSTTTGLTVSKGGEVTPIELDEEGIATLTGINTGSVIKINGTCSQGNIISDIRLYNTLYSFEDLTVGAKYDVTGVYLLFESTKEILPRGAEDIVKTQDLPTATISIANISLEIEKQATIEATITPDAAKNTVTYTIKSGDEYITLNGTTITAKAVGEATITATIPESIGNYSGTTKDFTVTVTPKNIAVLPFAFNSGKKDIEGTLGMSQNGLGSDYGSAPLLKFDGTGDYVIIHFNGEPGKLSYDIKGNGYSDGTFTVQESEDGSAYTNIVEYTKLGSTETKTHTLAATSRYVKFIYTEKVNGNVGLGNISIQLPDLRAETSLAWVPETVTLTVGDAFTAPTLSNPNSVSGITYESSDTDVATVTDAGVIALAGATGEATITATFAGDATYKPATATCTIIVNALTTYTVTLNPNYPAGKTGVFIDTLSNTVSGNLEISLPAGTKSQAITKLYKSIAVEGYIFEGWYEAADGDAHREKTGDISKDITFYAHWKVPYTVTFITGTSTTIEPITETTANGITLPTATLTDCDDWTFLGWAETAIESETTTAPASILYEGSAYKPTANITLYAIYKRVEGGGGESATLTFDDTSKRTTRTTSQQVWIENGITLTNNKSESTDTVAAYYNPVRFYKSSEIIIEAPENITQIAATTSGISYATALKSSVGTEASANESVVTIAPTESNTTYTIQLTGGQTRLYSIIVTYGGGLSTSYYHSNPYCQRCENILTISKGVETNGTFTLDISGEIETCETEVSVVVKPTPANHYHIGSVTATTPTTGGAPTVIDNDNGTYTITYAANSTGTSTINVTFAEDAKATIKLYELGVLTTIATEYVGDKYTLPSTSSQLCGTKTLVGWSTIAFAETDTRPTENYYGISTQITLAETQTFYAVFAQSNGGGGGNGDYARVIEALDDWSGDYLIAYNDQTFANGSTGGTSGMGAEGNKQDLSLHINNNTIPANIGDLYNVTLVTVDSGYVLQTKDNKYNYQSSNANGLAVTDNIETAKKYPLTVTFNNENDIAIAHSHGAIFHYNKNQTGYFRFYKDGGQEPVYLYKKSGTAATYTGYTTSCAVITGIEVANPKTDFKQYDEFVFGGTVYAIDENKNKIDVTSSATFSGYDMKKAGTDTVTVTYNSHSTTYEITIEKVNAYALTWNVSGATNTGLAPAYVVPGSAIGTLPTPKIPAGCEGKTFVGWTESNVVNEDGTEITFIKSTTVPSQATTYYAVFARPSGNAGDGNYVKVTEDANDLSGEYLIVYEAGNLAFNGKLETLDAVGNTIAVTISNNTIASTDATDAAKFTIAKDGEGDYTIKSASGKYIGKTANDNDLEESESTPYKNTITFTDGNVNIIASGGAYLRYNKNSGAERFRYYKSTTYTQQQPIALYKQSGSSASYTDYTTGCHDVTITYYGFTGGYTTNCDDSDLNVITQRVNSSHTIPTCTKISDPTTLGRTFLNLWKDQNGKEHKPGESFIVTQDITLYAQWKLETTGDIELPADKEDLATTDIVVTGGKTLTIPEGETITINSLTLKGGLLVEDDSVSGYAMPVVNIPTGATLVRKNTTINLDLVVNSDSWYPFAVPFALDKNDNIDYLDPVLKAAATYNKHFAIKTYDGENRAKVGTDQENNWDKVPQAAGLQPGKGYIISALTYPDKDTATIRIPMSVPNEWLANGEQTTVDEVTRDTVPVTAYTGAAATEHQRHAGWNFVANPYLANFVGTNASGSFINGELLINKGDYSYSEDEVPYVTIPTYNFAHYYQVKLSEATLSPAYSFFVQVGTDGTMTFGRQQAPASIAARNAEERPVKMDVDITLSDNHSSDQTGIIISDRYSDAYEIGRDLEKLFGSAYNLSVYTLMADNTPLAFQALAIRSNMQVIPVGYRAPEQGEYTFRLNEATSSIDLLNEQYEQLVLVDYQTGELTNLLISDYTFYSERTQADNRFAIYAVPRQNAPTDLPNAIGQDKEAQKIIHNGHLYILRDGNVYNGNGQIVK